MSFTEQEIEAAAKRLMETPGWAADAGRPMQAKGLARAALAAVTESRTVTDVPGLDALPVGSAVLDDKGFVYEKWQDPDDPDFPWWATLGDSRQYGERSIALPARVLHYGEGAGK